MAYGRYRRSRPGRLARAAAILSILTCYGTLAVVAALAARGITLAVNVHLWAAAIVLLALLAVVGVALGWRRHRALGPLVLAAAGAALVAWAMYGSAGIEPITGLPPRAVEIVGFAALALGALWDWRLQKRRR